MEPARRRLRMLPVSLLLLLVVLLLHSQQSHRHNLSVRRIHFDELRRNGDYGDACFIQLLRHCLETYCLYPKGVRRW